MGSYPRLAVQNNRRLSSPRSVILERLSEVVLAPVSHEVGTEGSSRDDQKLAGVEEFTSKLAYVAVGWRPRFLPNRPQHRAVPSTKTGFSQSK